MRRARQWRGRNAIEPRDPHDFLDEIGRAFDVGPERGHLHDHLSGGAGKIGELEPKALENAGHFRTVEFEPGQPLHLAPRKHDALAGPRNPPSKGDLRDNPAAQFNHQPRRKLKPRKAECRIDAAFEPVARVRMNAEPASAAGDIRGIPKRRFDQHVRRRRVAARGLAAHDPGQRFDARVIGDNHIVRVEPVGPAIERGEFLARHCAAHGNVCP